MTLSLAACSTISQDVQKPPVSSINQDQQTSVQTFLDADDAVAVFSKNKDYRDYKVLDYVVVRDDKLPLLKAVISFYDPMENNSCNLAFMYGDFIQRVGFAVNEIEGEKTYEIAENSRLTYVGDGTVSTSIRKIDTNESLNYKITFSYDEQTSTTDFKIVSEKPTN